MLRRSVTAPDGTKWTIGRRWLPRWRKLGRIDPGDGLPDLGGDVDDGIVGVIVVAILAVIAAIVIAFALFNVVAIAIELLIFLLALIAGIFSRVVLGRPWTVFAKSGQLVHERHAIGWHGSRRVMEEMASRLGAGLELRQ